MSSLRWTHRRIEKLEYLAKEVVDKFDLASSLGTEGAQEQLARSVNDLRAAVVWVGGQHDEGGEG